MPLGIFLNYIQNLTKRQQGLTLHIDEVRLTMGRDIELTGITSRPTHDIHQAIKEVHAVVDMDRGCRGPDSKASTYKIRYNGQTWGSDLANDASMDVLNMTDPENTRIMRHANFTRRIMTGRQLVYYHGVIAFFNDKCL